MDCHILPAKQVAADKCRYQQRLNFVNETGVISLSGVEGVEAGLALDLPLAFFSTFESRSHFQKHPSHAVQYHPHDLISLSKIDLTFKSIQVMQCNTIPMIIPHHFHQPAPPLRGQSSDMVLRLGAVAQRQCP